MFRVMLGNLLRTHFVFLLFLALTPRLIAQPLPDRRTISGRVASTKNVPVGGAQIQIRRNDKKANAVFWGASVLSDVAGEWSVPNAEDGDYLISVNAPGYEVWTETYTLKEYAPPLRISLHRQVALSFTLKSPDGQPLRDKRAAIFGFVTSPGQYKSSKQASVYLGLTTKTTVAGECYLSNQSVGIYHAIYVAVRGVGYAKRFERFELTEGDANHFDFQLQKAPASLIVKALEDSPAARPIGNAQVRLLALQVAEPENEVLAQWLFRQNDSWTQDGTGILRFSDLLPGHYEFRVDAPFGCRSSTLPTQTMDVTGRIVREVVVSLPPCQNNSPAIELTVRDEQGVALANRDILILCQPLNEFTNQPIPPNELLQRHLPAAKKRRGLTNDKGQLTLYPFWEGFWQLTVSEADAQLPFLGSGRVKVAADGAKITIPVALNPEIEE